MIRGAILTFGVHFFGAAFIFVSKPLCRPSERVGNGLCVT